MSPIVLGAVETHQVCLSKRYFIHQDVQKLISWLWHKDLGRHV